MSLLYGAVSKLPAPIPTTPTPPPPPPPPAPPPSGFLTREGQLLKLNGETWRAVGWNPFGLTGCQGAIGNLTSAEFDNLFGTVFRPNSLTRTWCFSHSDLALIRLTVAKAEQWNQKLCMSLFEGAGHCGSPGYNGAWYSTPSNTHAWIDFICNEFKNSTAIGMWELMNEGGAGATHEAWVAWNNAVAARIKSKAPNHLTTSGAIGSWPAHMNGETAFAAVHASEYMDILHSHEYEYDYNGNTGVQGRHAQELRAANTLNKPLMIGEFGTSRTSCTDATTRATVTTTKYKAYLDSSPAVCAVMCWATAKAYISGEPACGIAANESFTAPAHEASRNFTHANLP
jgi:mannan endo-1,4-beta-mannosidase